MKLTLLADNLQRGITKVSHAVSPRSQLSILLNFLLVAKDGFLTISATDLEIGIISKISAKIDEEGSITVPAKTFLDLISSLSNEKVTLELVDTTLILTGNGIKTTFPTNDSADFPQVLADKGEKRTVFKKDVLEKEMGRIVFAASSDSGRPALSGVLIKGEGKGFVLVATDGYRLSLKKDFLESEKSENTSLIVPARAVRELISMGDEDISLYISEKNNQVVFETPTTILVARLIDAEYPDYQKIIPQDFGTRAVFDRAEMLAAVKQGAVFAREASNIIKLSVEKERIVVSANAPSVGENVVDFPAKVTGEENEIAFNAKYLLDLLGTVDDENLVFEMTGPLSPGVFKSEKDPGFLHLIMPIRVQS